MRRYWLYRLLFFGCVLLSMLLVSLTVASRQRSPARAEAPRTRAAITRPRDPQPVPVNPANAEPSTLSSRVRITALVPYRREIELYNFGEAAEDLTRWQLTSPRPGGEDTYTFPIGTLLFPGEAMLVVVDEGLDTPGVFHWRVGGDQRVLDLPADTVSLVDQDGTEVSRFSYTRR